MNLQTVLDVELYAKIIRYSISIFHTSISEKQSRSARRCVRLSAVTVQLKKVNGELSNFDCVRFDRKPARI